MEYIGSSELSENVVSTLLPLTDIVLIIVLGAVLLFISILVIALAIAGIKSIITALIDEWDYL